MKKNLPAILASVVFLFSSFYALSQNCPLLTHSSLRDFNSTPKGAAASLWLTIHTRLEKTDLVNNGDYLLFTGGTFTLTGVASTPTVTDAPVPYGRIIADNSVTTPITSYDLTTNTWTTRIPPGFSTSDIFISGGILNSSTGFSVSGDRSSTVSGHFYSNRPPLKESWFFGLAAYQPPFSYSAISSPGQVTAAGGGREAGTPIPEELYLVEGGFGNGESKGGGGSNFTGAHSSMDHFTTCQKAACNLSGTFTKTDVTCNGAANGTVTVTLTGGTGPYSYSRNGSVFLTTADAVHTFNGVPADTYPLVISDNAGCTTNLTVTVSQPAALQVSGVVANATGNLSNGSITVTVSGGTSPYSFHWNTGATTQNLTGIGSGTYTLTVTDANGCTASLAETLTGGQTCSSFSATATKTDVTCNGAANGTVTVTLIGGTGPYSYSANGSVFLTTPDAVHTFTGVSAGTYPLVISDSAGCTTNITVTVSQPAALTVSGVVANATGNLANGAISVTVSGGTSPYSFHWNTGATTQNLTGIGPGTYTLTVTDANGCTASLTETLTGQTCSSFSATATATDAICSGTGSGTVTVTLTGGTGPYSYSRNGSVFLTTADAVTTFNGVSAGTYPLVISDNAGCTTNLTVTVSQPAAFLVSGLVVNAINLLANGSITVTVSGGTPPYSFKWNTGATTQNLTGIGPGTYYVLVTDAHGCTNTLPATVLDPVAPTGTSAGAGNDIAAPFGDSTGAKGTRVYPNPSNGLIYLQVDSKENANATINVVDMSGRILKSFMMSLVKGINYMQLQMPAHSTGVYMLQIKTSKEMKTLPILLTR